MLRGPDRLGDTIKRLVKTASSLRAKALRERRARCWQDYRSSESRGVRRLETIFVSRRRREIAHRLLLFAPLADSNTRRHHVGHELGDEPT